MNEKQQSTDTKTGQMLEVSERKFKTSITKCFDRNYKLSKKQMKIIENLSKEIKVIKKNQVEITELKNK